MKGDNSRFFSVAELLGLQLPGYPLTRQGWDTLVKRDKWGFREAKGLGGPGGIRREYTPPPEVMTLIESRQRGEVGKGVENSAIGSRLVGARESLGLTPAAMGAKSGMTCSAYQKFEAGHSQPCADDLAGFIQLGINANWLLTGEGPMLLADLHKEVVREVVIEKQVVRGATPINLGALQAILGGILQMMGDKPNYAKAAQKAVEYYQDALDEGLITPTGIGEGGEKAA